MRNKTTNDSNSGYHHVDLHESDCIIVEMDDISVKPLSGLDPNHIPIFPEKGNFSVSMKGTNKTFNVNRFQFPIVPRFSCTAHKAQGMTLSKAIVDLVPIPTSTSNDISFSYVPLSRVRRLEDLTILRPFNSSVIKNIQPCPACNAMMEEYRKLDICKDM